MALGDNDLDVFFADGAQVSMPSGVKFMANLDWPESVEHFANQFAPGMVVGKPTLTYPTKYALVSDMLIKVDGVNYRVCHVTKIDDGKISVAELNKA